MSTSLKRTKSGIKTNQADENSSPDLRLDASSSNSDSDSEPSKPTKKAKRLTKPAVNFDASGDDSDLDYDDLAVNDAQKKSLAEKAKRRLSSKFGARKSLNPLNGRSVSISNLEGGGTPIKASSFSTNRSSPAVESVVGGGGGRVGALARARENQARNASRNSTGLQPPGPAGENRPMISTEVMNNNYDEWMKMATDNKINVNNTWSFALIDYFHDMSLLRNPEAQGGINFQKASCTLDGCVKIWTSRVDSVATETGKLLSGLAEEANNLANTGLDGESSEEEGGNNPANKVKKPRTRTANANSTSLVDFNDKIKVKDLELEFTVDPLFKKTCADFDEGGPGGILMSHLSIDSSMTIVFDASGKPMSKPTGDDGDAAANDDQEEETQPLIDVTKLKSSFIGSLDNFQERSICPCLSNFKFSASDSIQCFVDLSGLAEAPDPPLNDDGEVGTGGDFFASGYSPNPGEMDYGMGDGMIDDDDEEGGGVDMVSNKMPNEKDLVMALVDDSTSAHRTGNSTMGGGSSGMFDYFDKSLKKMWAGPEHWKLRRTVVSKSRDEEGQSTMTRTRREKTAFSFDFAQPLDTTRKAIFQASTVALTLPGYKPPKPKSQRKIIKKITGSKTSAGSKQMLEQHCLPDDMHFNAAQLLRFDMKPKATFNMRVRSGATQQNPVNTEIDENYWAQTAAAAAQNTAAADETNEEDDSNAAIPFATQFFQDEGDDIPDFEEEFDNPVGALGPLAEGDAPAQDAANMTAAADEDDLIAATQNLNTRVRPEFVSYAKKAKRVDVKKLKENIWRELEDLTKDLQAEPSVDQATPEVESQTSSRTFTKVIGGLRKMYPKDKMEEISTSFCFICLLHLANEKGLSIKPQNADIRNDEEEDTSKFVGTLEQLKIIKEIED